jgi:hypothetical protein
MRALFLSLITFAAVFALPGAAFAKPFSMTGNWVWGCCDHVFSGGSDLGAIQLGALPAQNAVTIPGGLPTPTGVGVDANPGGLVNQTTASAPFDFIVYENQFIHNAFASQPMSGGRLLLTDVKRIRNNRGHFQKNYIIGNQTGTKLGNFSFCPPASIQGTLNPNPANPNCAAVIAGQAYNGRFTGMQGQANHFGGTMQMLGQYDGTAIFQIGSSSAYRQYFEFANPLYFGGVQGYANYFAFSNTAAIVGVPGYAPLGPSFDIPVRQTGFPWFTGTIMASATRVSFGSRQTATTTGTDARDAMGVGNISLVSGFTFHNQETTLLAFPNNDKLTLTFTEFVPEPATGAAIAAGAGALLLLFRRRMDH